MVSFFRMSSTLPAIVLVLISLTGLGVGGVRGRGPRERQNILPVGFFGRWGEGGVEREVWFARGESAFLLCRISRLQTILENQPNANITWYKDDAPLQNKRAIITPEGHLNITKLVRRRGRASPETDEGVYRCMLVLTTHVKFMVSAPPITLHVAEMGRHVTVSANNVSAVAGSAIRLKCDIPSQPPAFIQWHNSQGHLPQDVRFTQPTSGVLQITYLEKSDGGVYRCSATNQLLNKTRVSDDILVSVQDPPAVDSAAPAFIMPSFLFPISNLTTLRVVERWGATLECLATGLPLPEITWQRKGVFDGDADPWTDVPAIPDKESVSGQGNLHINDASLSDAGPYACTATSRNPQTGKTVSITQEIRLVVIEYPSIQTSPRNVTALIAQTVRLNCSLRNRLVSPSLPPSSRPPPSVYFPSPRITWLKDGLPLQTDTRIELKDPTQLVFVNSVSRDTGVYQCMVTNEAGYATAWSYLLVNSSHDHPQPPRDLKYTLLSPTSVLLKWSVDESSRDQVIAFSVHLTELGPTPTESQVVSQTTSHYYEDLKPNTNYSFKVRAYSTLASDPSETVNFTTGEDVPLAVPEFTLEALSPSTLLVSWSPLPAEKTRGIIEGYKIQWQRRKKEYYNLKEVEPNVFRHVLTALHPGKAYRIRVLARTKAGYNENIDWPWKTITMPEVDDVVEKVVPLAPNMQVKLQDNPPGGGAAGVEVTWQRPPQDKSTLEGFYLRYRRGSGPWSKDISLPATATSYLIPGQEPGWYEIKLMGYNGEGVGAHAIEVFDIKGPVDKNSNGTSPVTNEMPTIEKVRLTPGSQTIVHLSWEVLQVSNKPVAFYTIKQELVSSSKHTQPILTRSTTKSLSIDGLVPFSTYEFSVRAHVSESEYGPYSPPVRANSMNNNIPSGPRAVSYKPKDPSTIELWWDAAHMSTGAPTKYQIIYTRNRSLPLLNWTRKDVSGSSHSCVISGLVSNTDYWFRVRGCRDDVCGSYSDFFPARIIAFIPTSSSKLYLIVGLTVTFTVLVVCAFAVYMLKFRGSNSGHMQTSNANGTVGGGPHDEIGGRGSHPGGRNGVSDVNGREGDYVPMLNKIHTDLPTSPLDTKGGYNTRVNGFGNTKCNGVVRGKDIHYGSNPGSKRDDDLEERQRLFSPSRNGDLVARVYGNDTPQSHEEEGDDTEQGQSSSPQPPKGGKGPPVPPSRLNRGNSPPPREGTQEERVSTPSPSDALLRHPPATSPDRSPRSGGALIAPQE